MAIASSSLTYRLQSSSTLVPPGLLVQRIAQRSTLLSTCKLLSHPRRHPPGPLQLRVPTSYAVVDCATPPTSSDDSAAAFRDSLLPLLAALPAAAAPTGFATLQSGGGAFARGFCLGASAPRECLACLAAAAKNLTGCGASRRAGVWRAEGCFLSYADDNTSSAYEESFLQVVYSGEEVLPPDISCEDSSDPGCFEPRRLVALAESLARRGAANSSGARVVADAAALSINATVKTAVTLRAQCARDRAAAECARCLGYLARVLEACTWWLDGEYAYVAADVVGYNCFLRIEASVPKGRRLAKYMKDSVKITLCVTTLLALVFTALTAAIACVDVRKNRPVAAGM
ncbi:uncharacterized protein [Triticum aestivum]|uniref:uncharacterized protein n=1 Tax=Triticum aestivum TaxID=4565 RepID=UPI001D010791|nr:uncharacterized protein LOC123076344 [Triticum aestivum]